MKENTLLYRNMKLNRNIWAAVIHQKGLPTRMEFPGRERSQGAHPVPQEGPSRGGGRSATLTPSPKGLLPEAQALHAG